ncbi:VOC family protein [Microbispora sp. ATCC PTA-5024]|uniref:VOC family protein n=1 Tax=Microbispora sp. ATCC PTA-5024 TaxID=316330 RepID=UPI0003DC661D|nr:VOC family protein [Microbispora sp. ATCC PTA-5024]ETK35563.1 extradiol dioxygenase [Microbispora sp. ATCC PTA-5024]
MINGVHMIVYSRDAEADRDFLRNVLGFPWVDAGDGWLIFKTPPGEAAVHPTDGPGHHEIYLMCDDIKSTEAELADKGVRLARPVSDQGWGLLSAVRLPGGGELGLYEPRHPTAHDL